MNKKKYHFIAIGGIGMSGLAKYLLENGYEVSGSDISDSKYVEKLRKLGAKVFIGHAESNLPDDCVVVASSAIHQDNPEIVKAKRLGLPIFHRSDLLAEISRSEKCFIGFAGTHGKTTTSGLCSYVLEKGGLEPSFVDGGIVPELNTNAQCKNGAHFVAELDESDGTIVKYSPNIAVVNNLEADHLDFYKNGLEDVLTTFQNFICSKCADSRILLNIDDSGVKDLQSRIYGDIYTYALDADADFVANNINFGSDFTTFDVYYKNSFIGEFKIILKGRHNVYNSLAVIAALYLAGVDVAALKEHFATFTGMGRRFQFVGKLEKSVSADIYDDYAHHPTEIKATLDAAKAFAGRRVVAVFQPHRFTRLQSLWNDFLSALNADMVVVTDVYAASEDSIEGVTGEAFAAELGAKHIAGDMKTVAAELLPLLNDNDVIIGLGAGTITNLGKELLALDKEIVKLGN
ncbi:MAG: UDP-N-acetylmuramate--L-alanine ligase [Fusobacterium sp.]|nr:UDP-N-acetylmuramate--L-alanine ligase [Fusobacterium sp.]